MAGASDKARFYLEQSVPELQELERKKIFTKREITSIAKRRSDFEHKINARGSQPSDYVKYTEYEMNLETLRRHRVKRLGVKSLNHNGQRRIFFVLDRATKKFHGDIGLWMQYITYARKQKSNKKVSEILTRMLRLHPTKPELWIFAANYAMEERGDMMEARSYMQRGLRLCKSSADLWVEYVRLEMIYCAKIAGRRRILGLDQPDTGKKSNVPSDEGIDGDEVALPVITAEDIDPDSRNVEGVDQEALKKLEASPALSGAIPMAIFDAATNKFRDDEGIAVQLFDMVMNFTEVPCQKIILDHILDALQSTAPNSPETLLRFIRQPVIGIKHTSSDFPASLGTVLDRFKLASGRPTTAEARSVLNHHMIQWILSYLEFDDLDQDICKVLQITMKKAWDKYQSDVTKAPHGRGAEVAGLVVQLQNRGVEKIAKPAREWALRTWPNESLLQSLRSSIP